MSNALIKDYSYLNKDLASLKAEIWTELVNCSTLLNKARKLDKTSYEETFSFLGEEFSDIWDDYCLNLEKTKDFDIMLFLNKTWKAQRLIRRLKKTLKGLKTNHRQLDRAFINLNLDARTHSF